MNEPSQLSRQFHGTEAECLQQAAVDAAGAARNGYVPISQVWAGSDPNRDLTVIYEFRGAPVASGWITPAAVSASPAPGWTYVGFWRRALAFAIDAVLLSIVFYAVLFAFFARSFATFAPASLRPSSFTIDPVTGRVTAMSPEEIAAMQQMFGFVIALWAVFFVIGVLYHSLLWWRFGATVGQLALGIQIRRETDGSRIGLGRAVVRYIGYILSGWILFFGFIWVAIDARKQGWHDKIAGTVAVRRTG